jgi:hypothetical protein
VILLAAAGSGAYSRTSGPGISEHPLLLRPASQPQIQPAATPSALTGPPIDAQAGRGPNRHRLVAVSRRHERLGASSSCPLRPPTNHAADDDLGVHDCQQSRSATISDSEDARKHPKPWCGGRELTMSTPQTLTTVLPPQYHLDHKQRYLPSPQDRYLPPPRPSSGFHGNIPTRPQSNLSNHQFPPPPPRTHSGMSNGYSQARAGAEYAYANGLAQQGQYDDLRRTDSRSSQHQRQLPLPQPQVLQQQSRAAPATTQMPPNQPNGNHHPDNAESSGRRRDKQPVDWVQYFGGKPPAEIITIHDDDSPAPPAQTQPLPPVANASSVAQHIDKKRRVNNGGGDIRYSSTNTPYSHHNGTSTESLQGTTAATSLTSQASSNSRLDGAQTGQKRKRNTRDADRERKKQETERSGPRGYLAEYGEYVPPARQKKQKEVVVPVIADVWFPATLTLMLIADLIYSVTNRPRRSMTMMGITSCTRIAG